MFISIIKLLSLLINGQIVFSINKVFVWSIKQQKIDREKCLPRTQFDIF